MRSLIFFVYSRQQHLCTCVHMYLAVYMCANVCLCPVACAAECVSESHGILGSTHTLVCVCMCVCVCIVLRVGETRIQ